MRKRKLNYKNIILFILIVIVIVFGCLLAFKFLKKATGLDTKTVYLASSQSTVKLYNDQFNEETTAPRGAKVKLNSKEIVNETDKQKYNKITYQKKDYFIPINTTVEDRNDAVLEKEKYIRTSTTLYKEAETSSIEGFVKKGEKVSIIGFNQLKEDGTVDRYEISYNDNKGYIYSKYTVDTEEQAKENYDFDGSYKIHANRLNYQGGGSGADLDYFPVDKPKFENNVMPEEVRALYLNVGTISNIDAYIELAKNSKINAFVVDIKDNTEPGYASKVMERLSPTNFKHAANSMESYKAAIKKLKDAGFYVIGRITTFKDSFYIKDHPENAILNNNTGEAYEHDGSYWPTAFNRNVWEYNVELAKEAVTEMGFNEIQFDYVRFPDRTQGAERDGIINYQNKYDESKAQAIQNFLMYACDEIHKTGAYVSADVFGESAHNYVTGYGQYWGAISNVVDVISGMPYPELFGKYEYGFTEPVWTTPYKLLNFWASNYVVKQQALIPTPAVVRTWIQAYDATWKSPAAYYGAEEVSDEIKGLYDAGLKAGFIAWNSGSGLTKYNELMPAFSKEY